MISKIQSLGRALMNPVAVLPVAGLLYGIGNAFIAAGTSFQAVEVLKVVGAFIASGGAAVIDNMSLLFAIGVAYGLSKDHSPAAAVTGFVFFMTIMAAIGKDSMAKYVGADNVDPAFGKINNQFIGILSGILASIIYNKTYQVELPNAIAFFSGRRLAPIIASFAALLLSLVLVFVWPVIFSGIVAFGKGVLNLGALGAGIFGFANRLLIPTGLHHALNAVFWFDVAGVKDLNNFLDSVGTVGETGRYMAGFFPIMMFGLPAAALAMILQARPENRKKTATFYIAAMLPAIITGITEPIEFSFMFLAPVLYLAHALLTGLSMFVAATFHWTAGFGFSAGLVDFLLSLPNKIASQPYMLLVLGVVMAVLYFVVFTVLIKALDLKTPGRELDTEVQDKNATLSNSNYTEVAKKILEGLGGKDNIASHTYCSTRLRTEVKDRLKVNESVIKEAGVAGVVRPSKNGVQIIIGPKVQFVHDAFDSLVK